MPPQVIARLKQAGTQVSAMTLGQKVVAVIGVGVLLLGGSFFLRWATEPDYVPLFTSLSGEDQKAIADLLTSDGVPYQVQGTSLLVPAASVDTERMNAAAAGLPQGAATGYSLLDDTSITTTQFQQKVTYQRAVEGELSSTIQGLDGVTAAVVHLAIPEETVYTEQQQKPTASVLVDTSAGEELDNDQVDAIIHLVSYAVPGLDANQVTVSDSSGQLLSAAGVGATGGGDERTAEYETKTQGAIQSMLDRVLGTGKAMASVNATLNFDQTNRVSQTYTPSGAPAQSESSQKETYSGAGGTAVGGALGDNGVLGVDGTSVTDGTGTTGDGSYVKENVTSDNSVNSVVDNTLVAPGDVERQSVAVVVDQAALANVGAQNLQTLVATAAGYDEARGDVVTVTPATFDTTAADAAAAALAEATAAQESEAQWALIRQGAIALGVLLLAIVLLVAWRKAMRRGGRESVDIGQLERVVPAGPVGGQGAGIPALAPLAPTPEVAQLVAPEPEPEALRRQEFGQLVDSQPTEVANLLRGWLAASKKG